MAVIAGAIRWDSWYNPISPSNWGPINLGPAKWQFRAPWFFNCYPNDNVIDGSGDRQLIMDLEIGYAVAAGLKFWAFDQYASTASLTNAWKHFQTSSLSSQINWCWIANPTTFASFTSSQYVTWFQQTNYQKVLAGRPLIFILVSTSDNLTTLTTTISNLRSAASGAGVASPYVVIMENIGFSFSTMQTVGADAISNYNGSIPSGQGSSYVSMDTATQSLWVSMKNTGAPMIPVAQMGWDTRPIQENPPPYYPNPSTDWVVPGTVQERANHLQAAVNFVNGNPTACESGILIIYAWTECTEGGGALIPTVGDPPPGAPPALNNILSAIAPIIR